MPKVFDNYCTDLLKDGKRITLKLWDTAGTISQEAVHNDVLIMLLLPPYELYGFQVRRTTIDFVLCPIQTQMSF